MHVYIRDVPELRVAGVSHTGPYDQISEAFGRLGKLAGAARLFQQPGAAMVGIYHDDPESTPADQLRSDAAIVVPEGIPLPNELKEQRVPAGRYAVAVHVGPYDQLPDAWRQLMGEWLPTSGERAGSGASYEYYMNDPTHTPAEQLETEIRLPLA